jgi:mycothiol synthase
VVFGPSGDGPSGVADRRRLQDRARAVLDRALEPAWRDDRFDGDWPPADLAAVVELIDGRPTGYLGGTVSRDRLQLDGLLVEPSDEATTGSPVSERADALWRALDPAIVSAGAGAVELWGRPARPWHQALAERQGLTEARALHQLRCSLPVEVDAVPTRPFVPGRDEEALVEVNNRAFSSHPDQGAMTVEALTATMAEPWFRADGVRLNDDPDRPGHLAGFCWTKVHEPLAPGQPRLGEIYAIGVDPSRHGQGLGVPMTGAGLRWLAGQGLTTGMLYVEADNQPALATYDRIGFRQHRTDRAWHRVAVR